MERCKESDEVLKLSRQDFNLSSSILSKCKWNKSVLLGNSECEVMKPESEFELCRQKGAAAHNKTTKDALDIGCNDEEYTETTITL